MKKYISTIVNKVHGKLEEYAVRDEEARNIIDRLDIDGAATKASLKDLNKRLDDLNKDTSALKDSDILITNTLAAMSANIQSLNASDAALARSISDIVSDVESIGASQMALRKTLNNVSVMLANLDNSVSSIREQLNQLQNDMEGVHPLPGRPSGDCSFCVTEFPTDAKLGDTYMYIGNDPKYIKGQVYVYSVYTTSNGIYTNPYSNPYNPYSNPYNPYSGNLPSGNIYYWKPKFVVA